MYWSGLGVRTLCMATDLCDRLVRPWFVSSSGLWIKTPAWARTLPLRCLPCVASELMANKSVAAKSVVAGTVVAHTVAPTMIVAQNVDAGDSASQVGPEELAAAFEPCAKCAFECTDQMWLLTAMDNFGTNAFPRWACPPCNRARRATEAMRSGSLQTLGLMVFSDNVTCHCGFVLSAGTSLPSCTCMCLCCRCVS